VTDLTPNFPETVAEIREVFVRYEQALIENAVTVLMRHSGTTRTLFVTLRRKPAHPSRF
jgi:hypothetical protein